MNEKEVQEVCVNLLLGIERLNKYFNSIKDEDDIIGKTLDVMVESVATLLGYPEVFEQIIEFDSGDNEEFDKKEIATIHLMNLINDLES